MTPASFFVAVALLMAGAWWLSGYDARVTGENPTADLVRRVIRCGITLVLLMMVTINALVAVVIFWTLGFMWASCGAEFFTRRFQNLIDPEDNRKFDPKETHRNLDRLAQLVRQGRNTEALDLCKRLEAAGDASFLSLEATTHRIYQETLDSAEKSPLFSDVRSIIERRDFDKAESCLKQMLAGQPTNWAAMLLLMRIYAKDLSQPDKALALLQPAGKQPPLHPALIKYARQSIDDWCSKVEGQAADSNQVPADFTSHPSPVAVAVSIDELLKGNQLATAVEALERAIAEEPKNFDLWLKLAEVYGVNCADLNRVGKIIHKMESSSNFTAQEIQLAKTKLREWRTERRS